MDDTKKDVSEEGESFDDIDFDEIPEPILTEEELRKSREFIFRHDKDKDKK